MQGMPRVTMSTNLNLMVKKKTLLVVCRMEQTTLATKHTNYTQTKTVSMDVSQGEPNACSIERGRERAMF